MLMNGNRTNAAYSAAALPIIILCKPKWAKGCLRQVINSLSLVKLTKSDHRYTNI